MQQDVFNALKSISFFSPLADDVLNALASKAVFKQFPRQALIIYQGEISHSLHIILSGKVRILVNDEDEQDDSRELLLRSQGAGSYFGELALFAGKPRSATVKALEKTSCAVIAKADVLAWITQYPEVATLLLGALADQVMELTKEMHLMSSNVYTRLRHKLYQLRQRENDVWVIKPKPTQEELASMVGACREMVSKIIRQLVEGGYIAIEDRAYKLQELPRRY